MEKKNKLIWLTGLSGVGKTTIGSIISSELGGILLDGDTMRDHLMNTGFTRDEVVRNILDIGAVARYLHSVTGVDIIVCSISPFAETRKYIKDHSRNYIEFKFNAPLSTLEQRDTKGLYKKRAEGIIDNLAGVDFEYEDSEYQVIDIDTSILDIEQCIYKIFETIKQFDNGKSTSRSKSTQRHSRN